MTEVIDKAEMFIQSEGEGGGVKKVPVAQERRKEPALTEEQAATIGRLMIELEEQLGKPQDFEWGYEKGMGLIAVGLSFLWWKIMFGWTLECHF